MPNSSYLKDYNDIQYRYVYICDIILDHNRTCSSFTYHCDVMRYITVQEAKTTTGTIRQAFCIPDTKQDVPQKYIVHFFSSVLPYCFMYSLRFSQHLLVEKSNNCIPRYAAYRRCSIPLPLRQLWQPFCLYKSI